MELACTIWALWMVLGILILILGLAFEKFWLANIGLVFLIIGLAGLFAMMIIGTYLGEDVIRIAL